MSRHIEARCWSWCVVPWEGEHRHLVTFAPGGGAPWRIAGGLFKGAAGGGGGHSAGAAPLTRDRGGRGQQHWTDQAKFHVPPISGCPRCCAQATPFDPPPPPGHAAQRPTPGQTAHFPLVTPPLDQWACPTTSRRSNGEPLMVVAQSGGWLVYATHSRCYACVHNALTEVWRRLWHRICGQSVAAPLVLWLQQCSLRVPGPIPEGLKPAVPIRQFGRFPQ